MLGYFGVSIIHPTLTWTTGSLTFTCDLFACVVTWGSSVYSLIRRTFFHVICPLCFHVAQWCLCFRWGSFVMSHVHCAFMLPGDVFVSDEGVLSWHMSFVHSCCLVMFLFQMKEFCHDTCPFMLPVMFVFQMKEFCHDTCPLCIHVAWWCLCFKWRSFVMTHVHCAFMLPGDVCVSDEGVLSCHMPIVHSCCPVCLFQMKEFCHDRVLSWHMSIVHSCCLWCLCFRWRSFVMTHVHCAFMLPGDVCVSNEGVLSWHMSIVHSCCLVMFVFQMKEFCHVRCPLCIHVVWWCLCFRWRSFVMSHAHSCCLVMFVFQMKEFCHVTCPLCFHVTGDVCVSDEENKERW